MKTDKKIKKLEAAPNYSVYRRVLAATGDFVSALIVHYINYMFGKNDNKEFHLKTDTLHRNFPNISRAGLDKKLNKLVRDGHIIKRKGVGRHYHKCWFSPSTEMREACAGQGIDVAKVYYNLEMSYKNHDASIVYAAITNLLKTGDKLLLNYQKLSEGSGLSIAKVRKAVAWLIKNKKIEAKGVFGNKKSVSLPEGTVKRIVDLKAYLTTELPTESHPHVGDDEDQTEY